MNGWSFSLLSPGALGAALGAAAVITIGLYLLRLRRRQMTVPFIGLFEALILDKKSAALRSELRRWLSLLLSLLLVGALLLAFSDPHAPYERRGRHLVILLDVGRDMKSRADPARPSCLELGKHKVQSWFSSLGPGDEMLLVAVGARPRPLDTFTSDRARLSAALATVHGLDVAPDLHAALMMARDVLSHRSAPEIIIVGNDWTGLHLTEPKLAALPPLRFANLSQECAQPSGGEQADELTIESFSARRYPLSPDRFEVLLKVATQARTPVPAEITIQAIDEHGRPAAVLEVLRRDIQPGAAESLTFSNLGQADRGLLAHVTRRDGRRERDQEDNWARTVLSKRLPVRVLVVGPIDTFLEAALLIEDSLIVKHVTESSYPPAEDFDVTIFNGIAPLRSARTGAALYLGTEEPRAASHFPVPLGDAIEMFGFDTWDTHSPVFSNIDPYDVQVLTGFALQPKSEDQVLGRSEGRPIFVSGTRDAGRFLSLGFRPRKSDFVLRAAWPLFIINCIDQLYPRGRGVSLALGRAGTDFRVPVDEVNAATATLRGPLGEPELMSTRVVPVIDGQALVYSERAGFFDVETPTGVTRVAVSPEPRLDDGPARLDAVRAGTLGPYVVGEPVDMQTRSRFDPWFWLVACVLVVSYLEWWSYHRRWTV